MRDWHQIGKNIILLLFIFDTLNRLIYFFQSFFVNCEQAYTHVSLDERFTDASLECLKYPSIGETCRAKFLVFKVDKISKLK